MRITFASILCILLLSAVVGIEGRPKQKHKFEEGDVIHVYANNVGPYLNPTETYQYYKLPFCKPEKEIWKSQKMGEYLEGDRSMQSDYKLPFAKDITHEVMCEKELTKEDIRKFRKAVEQHYYFELEFDSLPVFGFVGFQSLDDGELHLNTHYKFLIEYNNNHVIRINVTTEKPEPLSEDRAGTTFEFSYSAIWTTTKFPFARRNQLYTHRFTKQELEIHWLSIMNSFVLVVLLTGFLAIIIMRVLKSDYARYARTEEDEDDQEDYGWKLIHGDVFRFPPHKNVFSAFVGIGAQFMTMVVGIFLLSLWGLYYPNNGGNMYISAIVLYALTASIGGFVSARNYKQMNGDKWAWNIVLTATLFAVPFVLVVSYVNSVAIYYKTTAALPALTIFEAVLIWACVGFPLTVLGGITGRRLAGPFEAPCRTKNFPREIPPIPFYRKLPFQMLMSGFLPFSAIYIELFYIYNSVWGQNQYYTLYGILFLVFIILNIVTACITVALTYFQLSMEDHCWWWNSFINGGSTGVFIYIYSIFYYIYRSRMTGLLQGSFYFAYMLVVCYFFFILLGSVGYFSSLLFVRSIYKNLKSD